MQAHSREITVLVVSEVDFDPDEGSTRNPALDAILVSYARRFKRIVYVAPAPREVWGQQAIADNVCVYGTPLYGKAIKHRLAFLARRRRASAWLRGIAEEEAVDLIQLRLPSLFALTLASSAFEAAPVTTYVAGDWEASFAANYPFPLSAKIGAFLDRLQRDAISRSIPVTTGPALKIKYADVAECHAYFSTSHCAVHPREVKTVPSRLLFVGRLEPLKRVEDAIEAVRLLHAGGHEITLKIIGDGRSRSALESQVQAAKLEDCVTFTGYVTDPDAMRSHYASADVLLLPSVSEGTPKVVAEAMAHGVIPIAVRTAGSNRYIIDEEVNGFLADERRPDQIAACVARLREQPGLLGTMVEEAYAYAAEHTVEAEMQRMWDFILDALSRRPEASSVVTTEAGFLPKLQL